LASIETSTNGFVLSRNEHKKIGLYIYNVSENNVSLSKLVCMCI